MYFTIWYIIVGVLLIGMAFGSRAVMRLPVTTALLYFIAGILLGPMVLGWIRYDPIHSPALLEHLSEITVLISLLSAGLQLRTPFFERRWWLPLRLASLSMIITIALVTLAGVALLHLPVAAAALLGAILAPTDPVLASEVEVTDWRDRDMVRFGLTGEAAINDGSAFPMVILGLGLLGLHPLGAWGWKWVSVDVVWGIGAGLGLGALIGTLAGRLVHHLIARGHRARAGVNDFLALGLLAMTYGLSELIGGYGFLAAFALGSGLRRSETRFLPPEQQPGQSDEDESDEASPDRAIEPLPGFAGAVLEVVRHLERLSEFGIVLLIGGMIRFQYLTWDILWFAPLLFLVIRPISVLGGILGTPSTRMQRGLMAWFGIKGIGSMYYIAYAIGHDLDPRMGHRLLSLTLMTVGASILVHGVSVTPLLNTYRSRKHSGKPAA